MRSILPSRLLKRLRVGAVGVLADRGVELAVGAEGERAAVVVGGAAEVVELEDDDFAAGHRDVAVGGEAADAVVDGRRRRRVVDVDEVVRRKVRVEGDAEQAALARGVDGEGENGVGEQRAVLDHAQAAALLADEQPAVGRELHRGGRGKSRGDCHFRESRWHGRGARPQGKTDGHQDERDAQT